MERLNGYQGLTSQVANLITQSTGLDRNKVNNEIDGVLVHSVYFWLNNPENSIEREEFETAIKKLLSTTIIRSKGMFWLSSRPGQAISWSQAGGSLKADSAGVWWSSMPYEKRIQYVAFVDNQKHIESNWDKFYGDRKNELVFIGQEMDEELIRKELVNCLSTEKEIENKDWKEGYKDSWPVQRVYSLE